jgi:asparagine synthase (glutamine-hydrolysing)
MIVDSSGERKRRYWSPDPSKKVRYKTKEEYGEHFRSLLEESVHCRLRSSAPIGVLMSGGLDSTSVTCLAARMTAGQPLTTISYVFDELADCDERVYINAVRDQYGLRSIQIPCDDAWPYKDGHTWALNPNQPEMNPYRFIKERAYNRAQTEGLRVLLTGGFGDHLYSGAEDWLADLVGDKKLQEAARELTLYLRYAGLRWTLHQVLKAELI